MRLTILIILLLAAAPPAAAQGIHLRWADCASGGGPSNNAFACNTNAQTHVLAPSFVVASATTVRTVTGTIDIVSASPTLPAWWEFSNCRGGSLFVNSSFVPVDVCSFFNTGCQSGIVSFVVGEAGPNTARIEFASRNCTGVLVMAPGVEYFATVLVINSTRTLPSPSCAGCETGVCLTLTRLLVDSQELTTPVNPDGNRVTWQGGGPGGVCQVATSTRRSVWGDLKALFR